MKFERADDAVLIRFISQAETGALEELYDRYHRFVFGIALAILNDHAAAEEVTLDVFVNVWRGAGSYDSGRARVSTWLAAISRHHAIDILRWQRSRLDQKSLYLDDLPLQQESGPPDPPEEAESHLQKARIRQAVAQLPPDQQEALMLAYIKGYSQRQIAELLQQPLGTVKTRVRLAMQKLREMLSEEPQSSDPSEDG
jgi:RNA polymerase sigma-70 factor (ECF subfamily)